MKSAVWLLAMGTLAMVGGCTPPAKTPETSQQSEGSSPEVAQGTKPEAATPEIKPDPKTSEPTEGEKAAARVAERMMTAPIATDAALAIKPPGSGDWKPSKEQPKLVQIGQKVDDALAKLPPAFVDARLTYKTEIGELIGKTEVMVQNDKMFKVTYNLPKNEAEQSVIIADGDRQAEKEGEKWRLTKKSGGEASASDLAAWPMEFPAMMFSPLTDNRRTWGPLFKTWAKQGTKIEERSETINGEKKVLYRILHESKDTQIEVILDGEMMLPTTVRSNYPRPGGGRNQMMWTGRWGFGGSHDAKNFVIPMASKQS